MTAWSKRVQLTVVAVVTLAALALAIRWSRPSATGGFATPADCLDGLCEASKDGDAARYLNCLTGPLRADIRRRFASERELAEHLRASMSGVSGWVQHAGGETNPSTAVIDLEELRSERSRLTRFRLERSSRGWLIVAIGPAEDRPLAVRPGTAVDEVREGSQPRVEP